MKLGQRIKQVRKSRGMTQTQLAVAIDGNTSAISDIEHGRSMPSVMRLAAIAEAFGMHISELLTPVVFRSQRTDREFGRALAKLREVER